MTRGRARAMDYAIQLFGDVELSGGTDPARWIIETAENIYGFLSGPDVLSVELLNRITQLEARMATFEQRYEDLRVAVDGAANRYAETLDALRAELAGMDQSMADRLTPVIDSLNALGADPANPVPDDAGGPVPGDPGLGTEA